jgi:hypothetical protein
MMETITEQSEQRTWLHAVAEAAHLQRVELPRFDSYGMGALRSGSTASGRFVTLKRRIVSTAAENELGGIEWALWQQPADFPILVAAFRESLEPEMHNVAATLALLKGWLVDEWTLEHMKQAVSKHPGAQPIKEPPSVLQGERTVAARS